jgi:hypothetical protein
MFCRKVLLIPFILSYLVTISCFQDPVNIDLSEFEQKIIIEANLSDLQEPQQVRVSRTVGLNSRVDFSPVRGAIVTIKDDQGSEVQLRESGAGLYQTSNFHGIPGTKYTLTVLADYRTYTAQSIMPQPLVLNNINLSRISSDNEIYRLSFSLKDHPGVEDYCLINVYGNGELFDHFLYQDHLNDGEEIVFDNTNVYLKQNDIAMLEVIAFDRASYEFYRTLELTEENEDDEFVSSFIPVTTFNPTTNLDNGALGYFSARTVRQYVKTVD